MWIRSQNRLSLGDYKEVYIIDSSIMGASVAADDTKLGDYETQERALEVLDQMHIHFNTWILADFGAIKVSVNDCIVFEMPKEEGGSENE